MEEQIRKLKRNNKIRISIIIAVLLFLGISINTFTQNYEYNTTLGISIVLFLGSVPLIYITILSRIKIANLNRELNQIKEKNEKIEEETKNHLMQICKYCGCKIKEDVCQNCGAKSNKLQGEKKAIEETKKEKKKKTNIFVTLIILTILIVSVGFGINAYKNNQKEKSSYIITYSSIEPQEDFFYAKINIDTNKTFNIKSSDFSILINNVPTKSNGILTDIYTTITPNGMNTSYLHGESLKVDKDGIISVKYDYNIKQLTSPITILYKGKTLTLGENLKFYLGE